MWKLEAREVAREAAGRWLWILGQLAPELAQAVKRIGRHGPCPVHGGRDGFRLFRDADETGGGICNTCGAFHDGFALLRWLKGWSFPETVEAVALCLGIGEGGVPGGRAYPPPPKPAPPGPDPERLRERLRRAWAEALPAGAPEARPLRWYLRRRGLLDRQLAGTTAIRFHPALPYWEDGEQVGAYPAMLAVVAVIRGSGYVPVTLHRTYLDAEGRKAPVPSPKKLMPSPREVTGGFIALAPFGETLGIAEGIETALAVNRATGMPVWATVSASLMEKFTPPPGVRKLVIWADRDRSGAGERAAKALKARMWSLGIEAAIMLPGTPIPPDRKGVDWNDVLMEQGVYGFPARYRELATGS